MKEDFALYVDSRFSEDLVTGASRHRQFLHTMHATGFSLSAPTPESIRRYTDLWLPLVNEHRDAQLIPPPDIAWLWHCHRLAPYRYLDYVTKCFGATLEARPPFAVQLGGRSEDGHTQAMWAGAYPEETFFVTHAHNGPPVCQPGPAIGMLDGYNLPAACERQSSFLWQISSAEFEETQFIVNGQTNYYKFLCLRNFTPADKIIVPTYQIDLMWHTHILASISGYQMDCTAIIGKMLSHDDSLNDRSDDSVLNTSFESTCALWMQQYNERYPVPGSIHLKPIPRLLLFSFLLSSLFYSCSPLFSLFSLLSLSCCWYCHLLPGMTDCRCCPLILSANFLIYITVCCS